MMYFVYGDDFYLIEQQKKKILADLTAKEDVLEYSYLEEHINTILNQLNTPSLFFENRIFIVNDSYFVTEEKIKSKIDNKNYLEELIRYIQNPNDLNTVIFICPTTKISKRLKITKAITDKCKLIKVNSLNPLELENFVKKYLASKNGTIEKEDLQYLLTLLPNNLSIIVNELDKLLLTNKNITKQNIDKVVSKFIDTDIFKLTNHLLSNKLNEFLTDYKYLKYHGLNDVALVSLLANSLILVRNILILRSQRKNDYEISNLLQVHPYRLKKLSEYLHLFTIAEINDKILKLYEIDYKWKKGIINKDLTIDLYLLNLFKLV